MLTAKEAAMFTEATRNTERESNLNEILSTIEQVAKHGGSSIKTVQAWPQTIEELKKRGFTVDRAGECIHENAHWVAW